jgi:tetratricopeptide (TPR) repeat protein
MLGTYRPMDAIVHTHPLRAVLTELRQHDQCAELVLDYLSEAAVTAYLCQRFGDPRLAAALAHVLHRRTQGNPLFLIAVVDELLRQQVVREASVGWEVWGALDTIARIVPANLRALIELQLAHLSPEDQALLEAASVAGVEFTAAAVAASLTHADEAVETRCKALAHQGQFLQVRGRAEWPDGTVTAAYRFGHALYQDVLYQRIPAGHQTRWHARIGARLAHSFGEGAGEMAAAVALHCVRGGLWRQAVPYLQQAARRAAYQEAVAYFEQALAALARLPEHRDTLEQVIDLRFDLRNALQPLNALAQISDHLRAAETLAERLGDPQRLGRIASQLCIYFLDIGAPERAMVAGQRALALATAGGAFDVQVTAQIYLGLAYHAVGDFRQALDISRQATASLTGARCYERYAMASLPAVVARFCMVRCLAELGGFDEGIRVGEDAVQIAEAADYPYSTAAALMFVGFLYRRQGDLRKAVPVLERSLALAQRANIPRFFPMIASSLIAAYTLGGRVAEAAPLLEQIRVHMATGSRVVYHALVLIELSEACLLAGYVDEACTLVERLLELSRTHTGRGYQAHACRLLGDVARHRAPPNAEQATAHYRQALTLAEALGMRPLQAHCRLGLGTIYLQTGRRARAHAELSAAVRLYRAMAMTCWRPQAEAALVQVEAP